jgi:putative transposase
MPRIRRIERSDRIFFITTNLRQGVRPFNEKERDSVLRVLASIREKQTIGLAGYVVMPDHVHLLLAPGSEDVSSIMQRFKRWSQHEISSARKTVGGLWQPRYFDHIIRRVRDFWEKLEYVHNNPVAAGLAAAPSEWRWSSYGAYGKSSLPIVPIDDLGLPTRGEAPLWPARYNRAGE